jgi:hypothetical protein
VVTVADDTVSETKQRRVTVKNRSIATENAQRRLSLELKREVVRSLAVRTGILTGMPVNNPKPKTCAEPSFMCCATVVVTVT